MPKRTNSFQHLVALIEHAIQADVAAVNESFELKDKITGDLREVDIVVNYSQASHPMLIGVECKGGGENPRPATVEWIEQMWGKHTSLPTDKLILVAKGGFTASAKKKASWFGIDCLSIEDADTCDWSAKIRNLESIELVNFLRPYVTHATLVFAEAAKGKLDGDEIELADINNIELFTGDDKCFKAGNLVQEWVSDPNVIKLLEGNAFTDSGTVFEFERRLKNGVYVIGKSGARYPVVAIKVQGKCNKSTGVLDMDQYNYGDVAVAHANAKHLGKDLNFVFTEKQGTSPIITISVKKEKA